MKLYIPTNALDRDDLISGFGRKEIKISGSVFAACLIAICITITISEDALFIALIAAILLMAIVVSLIWRDQCDESVLEKIRQIIVYQKSTKQYKYEYIDWLDSYLEELDNATTDSKDNSK